VLKALRVSDPVQRERQLLNCVFFLMTRKVRDDLSGYVIDTFGEDDGVLVVDETPDLPRSWTEDRKRCCAAGVPDAVKFATKPALASAMIIRAVQAGFQPRGSPPMRSTAPSRTSAIRCARTVATCCTCWRIDVSDPRRRAG
jgi:hypothetical protein